VTETYGGSLSDGYQNWPAGLRMNAFKGLSKFIGLCLKIKWLKL